MDRAGVRRMSVPLEEIRDAARRVLSELGPAAPEAATWPLISELGWFMIAVPEAQGGLGLGQGAAGVLQEELGRALSPAPYLGQTLAIEALVHSTAAGVQPLLQELMSGERRVATALGGAELTWGVEDTGRRVLDGTAHAAVSADLASHALVCCGQAQLVVLVPLAQPGVSVTARPAWDTSRRLFDLRFERAIVDESLVLAQGAPVQALAHRLGSVRDFGLAADSLGGGAAILEKTVEYLQTRRQFGRPLALFQALKHRCAELVTCLEAAQALRDSSLSGADGQPAAHPPQDSAARAAMVKQLACASYAAAAEEALQLHGGIGMTSEHDCHLYLKRALLTEQLGVNSRGSSQQLADRFLAACLTRGQAA